MMLRQPAYAGAAGCLAARRGLFPAPVREPLSDGDQSTNAPDEELPDPRASWPPSDATTLWCETPTASMAAAAMAEMAGKAVWQQPAPKAEAPPQREASAAPPASTDKTVMLQIPLQVANSHPLASGVVSDLKVSVSETSFEEGCMLISLRVDVGAGGAVALAPTMAPQAAAPTPQQPKPHPQTQVGPARQAGQQAMPPVATKSSMVCCHWKNKGWCKYGGTCKFLHPEHKRGAGLPGSCRPAGATQSAPVRRAGSLPGGFTASQAWSTTGVSSCGLQGLGQAATGVASAARAGA